jgi:uracil phosphoribosyltransferase
LDLDSRLEKIRDEFPIDVSSTRQIRVEGLRNDTKVFRVKTQDSPLIPEEAHVGQAYILDTTSGKEIACHPHIVGENLQKLCHDSAIEFHQTLQHLDLIEKGKTAILQILRAGLGYMAAEVFQEGTPTINIRGEYFQNGYRAHSEDGRRVRVTYSDYSSKELSLQQADTLIIPDTFASGRTAQATLNSLLDEGFKPGKIILYGFIAIPALAILGKTCLKNKIDMFSFSICNITQLAHNNYDMPLYGLDESLYDSNKQLRGLGSIVDITTLRRFLPSYVSGLDQPGDWSERQTSLFDGSGSVRGDIIRHLDNSIRLIASLRKLNSTQLWYDEKHDEIARRELNQLRITKEQIKMQPK